MNKLLLVLLLLFSVSAFAESRSLKSRNEQYSGLPIVEDEFHGAVGLLAYQETFQSFSNLYPVEDSRALTMQEAVPMVGVVGRFEYGRSPSSSLFVTGSYAHSESTIHTSIASSGNVVTENGVRNVTELGAGYEHRFDSIAPLALGTSLNFRSLSDDTLRRNVGGYGRKNDIRYVQFYGALPFQLDQFSFTPKIAYQLLLNGTQFRSGLSTCDNADLSTLQSAGSGEGTRVEMAISHIDSDDQHFELTVFYRQMSIAESSSVSCLAATGSQISEPKNLTVETGLMLQLLL
jgi:hypothetical protein